MKTFLRALLWLALLVILLYGLWLVILRLMFPPS
jgi:hypothetical protein